MTPLRDMAAQGAVWLLFFASSVYGHVALKLATEDDGSEGWERALALALDPWTLSGIASWCLSGVLWMAILDRSPLSEATSISALRYAFVILAAALVLHEALAPRQWVGIGLIAVGIALVKWKVET